MKEKKKKHTVRKILLIILIIIVLVIGVLFIKKGIDKANSKKFNDNINELSKKRIEYVFIEINPSLVLTIKDKRVDDVACLNNDCISIYDDINIKGKNINESINDLYTLAKNKGFDTSNGVKIKSSNNLSIETKDYITVEHIDKSKEIELLKEVKNNEEIKNVNNEDYYTKLWNELKKDKDYDDFYSCSMEDNELKCYFTDKFMNASEENDYNGLEYNNLYRVLDKFGIKHDKYGLYVNERYYYIVNMELNDYGEIPECEEVKSKNKGIYKITGYVSCAAIYGDPEKIVRVPLNKLNLLTIQYDSKDILDN